MLGAVVGRLDVVGELDNDGYMLGDILGCAVGNVDMLGIDDTVGNGVGAVVSGDSPT